MCLNLKSNTNMAGKVRPQKLKKRISRSYLTSTISISMVLFLIGMLGVVLLNAERLAKYVRENIGFTLVLNEDVQEDQIAELQKVLKATDFVKSVEYIGKEAAAERLKKIWVKILLVFWDTIRCYLPLT